MTDIEIPAPPSHLNGSAELFARVVNEWPLEAEELEILRLACESIDRAASARKAIRRLGMTYESAPHGAPRPRPELQIARSEAALAARLLKQLDLTEDGGPAVHRGPHVARGSGRVNRAKSVRG
jgi:hypothetical protein